MWHLFLVTVAITRSTANLNNTTSNDDTHAEVNTYSMSNYSSGMDRIVIKINFSRSINRNEYDHFGQDFKDFFDNNISASHHNINQKRISKSTPRPTTTSRNPTTTRIIGSTPLYNTSKVNHKTTNKLSKPTTSSIASSSIHNSATNTSTLSNIAASDHVPIGHYSSRSAPILAGMLVIITVSVIIGAIAWFYKKHIQKKPTQTYFLLR